MSLGNWDINKKKNELEFLGKFPATNCLPKLAKSLDLCGFPDIITTCHFACMFYFQPSKAKTTFLTPPAAYY